MRSSRWQAHGNIYLVTEDGPLSSEQVRAAVVDSDGILDVRGAGDDWLELVIWNPDGSVAEMSGNGTRIAARWLAARTGASAVTVRVGPREVRARMLDGVLVEQDLGEVAVGQPEEVAGITLVTVDVGNPHAVGDGDPAEIAHIGPLLETHERFPNRTNVQIGRRSADGEIEARVWERGVGETASSGSSAVAVAAAFGFAYGSPSDGSTTVRFPGGDLVVRFEGRRALLTVPAERVE
jgi:diaminopimelate epimerase